MEADGSRQLSGDLMFSSLTISNPVHDDFMMGNSG